MTDLLTRPNPVTTSPPALAEAEDPLKNYHLVLGKFRDNAEALLGNASMTEGGLTVPLNSERRPGISQKKKQGIPTEYPHSAASTVNLARVSDGVYRVTVAVDDGQIARPYSDNRDFGYSKDPSTYDDFVVEIDTNNGKELMFGERGGEISILDGVNTVASEERQLPDSLFFAKLCIGGLRKHRERPTLVEQIKIDKEKRKAKVR